MPAAKLESVPWRARPTARLAATEDRDEASRLDAELRQHCEHRHGQHQVAGDTAKEALRHRIDMRRSLQHPHHDAISSAREPQTDQQYQDCSERIQRVADDERQ